MSKIFDPMKVHFIDYLFLCTAGALLQKNRRSCTIIQAIFDEGKITCCKKSNYFALSKSNNITATESGIWWEHQRSFTSVFQMNDPTNFLCFPISTSAGSNTFFIAHYLLWIKL